MAYGRVVSIGRWYLEEGASEHGFGRGSNLGDAMKFQHRKTVFFLGITGFSFCLLKRLTWSQKIKINQRKYCSLTGGMKTQGNRIQVRPLQYNTQTSGQGGVAQKTERRRQQNWGDSSLGSLRLHTSPWVTQHRVSCPSPNHRSWSNLYVYETYLPVNIDNLNRL